MTTNHSMPVTPTTLPLGAPQFAVLAEDLLRGQHQLRFQATGGSMRPFIRDGDVLTAAPANSDAYRRGDIVLCRAGSGAVAHRVLALEQTAAGICYRVRGDASCGLPDSIPARDLLGRIVQLDRGARRRRLDSPIWRRAGLLWAWGQTTRRRLGRAYRHGEL